MESPATIAPEVIACIAQGRLPSGEELQRVADHIWNDLRGATSALSWGNSTANDAEQMLILRVARAALVGSASA
ncbi:MAG TPA: hypothetical protein VLG14_00395 [Sphingomonas sp.]|nr:hypothetical protein [Sphingomonas sp.]